MTVHAIPSSSIAREALVNNTCQIPTRIGMASLLILLAPGELRRGIVIEATYPLQD